MSASDPPEPRVPPPDELELLVKTAHREQGKDSTFQEKVIRDCMMYVGQLPEEAHMFCDPTNITICSYLLILFIFPASSTRDYYVQRVERCMASCSRCMHMFQVGRARLREDLLLVRKIGVEPVRQLLAPLFAWESARLVPVLQAWLDAHSQGEESLNVATSRAFMECLECPGLLRANGELRRAFDQMFERHGAALVHTAQIVSPGLVFLLFEGLPEQRLWALRTLQQHTAIEKITVADFDAAMSEEYEVHFYNIQDPAFFSPQRCTQFWCNMVPLLNGCEAATITERLALPGVAREVARSLSFEVVPLHKVFSNQFMSFQDEPLPFILRGFRCLLEKLGTKFWTTVHPFTFQNFLDPTFRSPHYVRFLRELRPSELTRRDQQHAAQPCVEDVVDWMEPFLASLTLGVRPNAANHIFLFAWGQLAVPNVCFVIRSCFTVFNEFMYVGENVYTEAFARESLLRIETRRVLDQRCKLLADIASGRTLSPYEALNAQLAQLAVSCVCRSLEFDVNCLAHRSAALYRGERASAAGLCPVMWSVVAQAGAMANTDLVVGVVAALRNACGVFQKDAALLRAEAAPKARELYSAAAPHYDAFAKHLADLLFKTSQYLDHAALQRVLTDKRAAAGFWSCVFCADRKVYQAAAQVLYEAFDVEARLEGITAALSLNYAETLRSINRALQTLAAARAFEPFPRAVRVLMDVTAALTDPVRGLLVTLSDFSSLQRHTLRQLWKQCWGVLNVIYGETLNWANTYQQAFLVEFTRDTLDLSDIVVSGFNVVCSALQTGPDDRREVSQSLVQDLLATFPRMLVWLRLGDELLLGSCVRLIIKVVDLTLELDLRVDSDIVVLLTKYGLRAPRFKNKLDETQRDQLLERAIMLNADLVEQTKLEIDAETSGRPVQPRAAPPARQSKITDAFKSTSTPPPAPAKPPVRLSMLEQAKLDLAAKRAAAAAPPSSRPAAAPAPPRPAGFNRRDASDSDSDSESDAEHIFVADKAQKIKKALASLKSGRSLFRTGALFQNRGATSLDQQRKKAEAYMRLRLNVDVKPLYSIVLQWSFSETSPFPPGKSEKDYAEIRDDFASAADYKKTFEPLLLLESWQGIQQAKQISQEKPFKVTIASRAASDSFFDVFAAASKEDVADRGLGEADLVALVFVQGDRVPTRAELQTQPSCLAKMKEIKSAKPGYADLTFRVATSNALLTYLTPGVEMYCVRVMQMTTVEREFSSLVGLEYYDLVDEIVAARPNEPVRLSAAEQQRLQQTYGVNESQAEAILGAVKASGFSLIQGPPGTGKTKTILGIVGHALTSASPKAIAVPGAPPPKAQPAKILVCAPSNAAVDEIVLRLRAGIRGADGAVFRPKVIRLGRSDAINEAVRDTTLEYKVDAELAKNELASTASDGAIREEHTKCLREREALREQLKDSSLAPDRVAQLELALQSCLRRKNELGRKLDEQRERVSVARRTNEQVRRSTQSRLLSEAQVICSTLSGSAHDVLAGLAMKFETVIVDEAAQCIELSAIIPLRYGTTRCIMVGDPNQLPPTVLSQAAARFKYEQSLFVRMMNRNPRSVYLLDVQYRMHPAISRFPSAQFYGSRLKDGPGMEAANRRSWHADPHFAPYLFLDTSGQQRQNALSKSLYNAEEARAALELVQGLLQAFPAEDWTGRIGIISPYKEQVRHIRSVFTKHFGGNVALMVDFNTVDGFQGQEKDIIIISCVRASEGSGVGFLADVRRMNVALTRARSSLWILGSFPALKQNRVWRALVEDARSRGCCARAVPGFVRKPVEFVGETGQTTTAEPPRPPRTPPQRTADAAGPVPVPAETRPAADTSQAAKLRGLLAEVRQQCSPADRPAVDAALQNVPATCKTAQEYGLVRKMLDGLSGKPLADQVAFIRNSAGDSAAANSKKRTSEPPGRDAKRKAKSQRSATAPAAAQRSSGSPAVPGLPADIELIPASSKFRKASAFTSPVKEHREFRKPPQQPSFSGGLPPKPKVPSKKGRIPKHSNYGNHQGPNYYGNGNNPNNPNYRGKHS